jgi:hypothetical protein
LAGREKLDAVVTIGAFTRLREFVPKIARGFVSDRYDNLAAIAALDEQIDRHLDGAASDVAALPAEIKRVPFGETKPVNP